MKGRRAGEGIVVENRHAPAPDARAYDGYPDQRPPGPIEISPWVGQVISVR